MITITWTTTLPRNLNVDWQYLLNMTCVAMLAQCLHNMEGMGG